MMSKLCFRKKTIDFVKLVFFLLLVFLPLSAKAATTEKDLQVVARAAAFTEGLSKGTLTAAVAYDAGSAASKADADNIVSIIGGGLSASGVTLKPVLVSSGSLGGLSGANIVIVASDSGSAQGSIFSAAGNKLTVSSDMSCVKNAKCVMGVASAPKVEIVVNRNAASGAGVSFAQAFRMMISEI